MPSAPPSRLTARLLGTIVVVVVGVFLTSIWFQTCLSSRVLAASFVSTQTWLSLAASPPAPASVSELNSINVSLWTTLVPGVVVALLSWGAGTVWLTWRHGLTWSESLLRWGFYGWIWWCLLDVWEWVWTVALIAGWDSLAMFLSATPQFWLAACCAGWLTTLFSLRSSTNGPVISPEPSTGIFRWLGLACGLYFLVFTTMNWRMYFNLLIPHGDSAMYEEHLWNLLHGKGFRSYLDRGLFFGEHIQFVHLFLLPLYVMWPSHLLLEACSSAALACGAFPVFWMVRRHTGSPRLALAAAVAYLLYTPMQFLDIEIDLKTFRPESFGIPLLLLTLDQLERRRVMGTLIGIAACLTVKEDYAIVFGPLGVWIACSGGLRPTRESSADDFRFPSGNWKYRLLFGLSLSVFSVVYLWLATRVLIPWFRSGDEVHFASYFDRFGSNPEEIVRTMLTKPWLVLEALATLGTALYAMALLAPLAFLPVLAPGRLAVGLPLFVVLCLVKLDDGRPPTPQHQFHAPLVAIVFWAVASALPRAIALGMSICQRIHRFKNFGADQVAIVVRNLMWTSSLSMGIFLGLSPLGISFWDAGSRLYWGRLYAVSPRAEMFARISDLIPTTARVASTDFVHPRYTHFERSYDYSDYYRKINEPGQRMPADTEYLVVDTTHEYSRIKRPDEVPEYRDHPDQWELLPDLSKGYFIVMKRKAKDQP